MGKVLVFIVKKKPIGSRERSLDLVLKFLKTNSQLDPDRWITIANVPNRIGRTSLDYIVIPQLLDLNLIVERFIPGFFAFEIKKDEWRSGKFHKTIIKNPRVKIDEDEKHYLIEVETNGV